MGFGGRRIATLDPGKTCGFCLVDVSARELYVADFHQDLVDEVLCWASPITDLAIERWFLYPKARINYFSDMPGPECIGMIKSWSIRHKVPMERVAAKLRIPYLKDVPDAVTGAHRRDACAHAIYWLSRRTGNPTGTRNLFNSMTVYKMRIKSTEDLTNVVK